MLAIITTDVPGCRDAIIPGVTGNLVPVANPFALSEAIEKLLRDRETQTKMGLAARTLAEKQFGIRKIVDEHLEIYNTLHHQSI